MTITREQLAQRQSLPLEQKIVLSQRRILTWYEHYEGQVYVSYSGGKDSTVLCHLIENTPGVYGVPKVFCDTGLEYPEVREIAMRKSDVVLRPKMNFRQVIEHYGYPCVSKEQANYIYEYRNTRSEKLRMLRLNGNSKGFGKISDRWLPLTYAPFKVDDRCCDVMKKRPFAEYANDTGRYPYLGILAEESDLRVTNYLMHGCNAFDIKHPHSTPLGFWTEQDVLRYLIETGIEYASVYGDIIEGDDRKLRTTGEDRTGCMFCMFGVQLDGYPNRFQRMQNSHPKQYAYCMDNLGLRDVLRYMGIPYEDNQMRMEI